MPVFQWEVEDLRMFRTVQLCKRKHLSTQQPQDNQEKYVYDVVDQSDALHDQMTKMAR